MLCGEKENQQLIVFKTGQELRLHLPSNPTTGYSWAFLEWPDEEVIKLVEETYLPDMNRTQLLGRGGMQCWTFASLAPGKTSFCLGYKRSWEDSAPLKTYRLRVAVRK